MTKKEIKRLYAEYISAYGSKSGGRCYFTYEISTTDLCFEQGAMLANSTIDKIEYIPSCDDVRFYYNENEGDYDHIENFKVSDVYLFYLALMYPCERTINATKK